MGGVIAEGAMPKLNRLEEWIIKVLKLPGRCAGRVRVV